MQKSTVGTISELAATADMSERQMASWKARPGFPKRGRGGYDVAACLAFIEESKEATAKRTGAASGTLTDLKAKKLTEEIGILKIKRGEAERSLIPVDEHLSELRTITGWFTDVFAQWISEVKVLTGDARVVGEAERLRDAALERMRERVEKGQ